jgi:ligand-binding SRPBCC domain-containing protein
MTTLIQKQFLPISLDKAWEFFSSPHNLNKMTPPEMTFMITSVVPEKMYEGMIITYKIAPFLNIPMYWCTEITHIKDNVYFIDEQRKGPYRIWHHEHHFKEVNGGIEMTDKLYYDIGMGIAGKLAGTLYVHRQVRFIFEFRRQKLIDLFGR